MQDGLFCKLIDPQTSAIKPCVRLRIAFEIFGNNVARGEFAGSERVVDALASERFDDTRGVADQQEI